MDFLRKIKGVIFDMDGTITVPSLDFKKIREEIGVPDGDIVEAIKTRTPAEQKLAWAVIEKHELDVIRDMEFQAGVKQTLVKLREKGIKLAILTRNSRKSVNAVLAKLEFEFDAVIDRDFPYIKPRPEPVLHIINLWAMSPGEILVIGDFIHDLECGKAAGTYSCFFHNPDTKSYSEFADFSVKSYDELEKLLTL